MSDLIMYQTEDGLTKIEVEFDNENAWLTQAQMVELFQTSKSNISEKAKLWWRVNPQPSSPARTMSASIAGSLHWPMPVSMLLSLQVILARV